MCINITFYFLFFLFFMGINSLISYLRSSQYDYIARVKGYTTMKWARNVSVIPYLFIWERLNNISSSWFLIFLFQRLYFYFYVLYARIFIFF